MSTFQELASELESTEILFVKDILGPNFIDFKNLFDFYTKKLNEELNRIKQLSDKTQTSTRD